MMPELLNVQVVIAKYACMCFVMSILLSNKLQVTFLTFWGSLVKRDIVFTISVVHFV